MTTHNLTKRRVGLMIGAHMVVGIAMALPSLAYPGQAWPFWIQMWYAGQVCADMLLLGMWAGFGTNVWWQRLLGLAAGMLWLLFLGLSTDPRMQNALPMLGFLGVPMLVVAVVCLGCRWLLVRLEQRDAWKPLPAQAETQFSLKSIFVLTLIVSVLLALGRLLHWVQPGSWGTVILVSIFILVALLSTLMLIWASLSQGRVTIRLPLAFAGSLATGLLVPYYTGGPTWRYAAWAALMFVIAAYVSCSLIVIRSCGYRLNAIWEKAA